MSAATKGKPLSFKQDAPAPAPDKKKSKRGAKPTPPAEPINVSADPVFTLFWQETSGGVLRNRLAHVAGDKSAEDLGAAKAVDVARTTALKVKSKVAICGPQFQVGEPPSGEAQVKPVSFSSTV